MQSHSKIRIMFAALMTICAANTTTITGTPVFAQQQVNHKFEQKLDVQKAIKPQLLTKMQVKDNKKPTVVAVAPTAVPRESKMPSRSEVSRSSSSRYSTADLMLLAKLVEAESGNQPFEGKLAVAQVVVNRTKSDKFPNTIKEVIYQKDQFQPVKNGAIHKKVPSESSLRAARLALSGQGLPGFTALYFYAPAGADKQKASWFERKLTYVSTIGDHKFFQ